VDPRGYRTRAPRIAVRRDHRHGFLTLALLSRLVAEAADVRTECKLRVNYGFNRLRFRACACGSQDSCARDGQRGPRRGRWNRNRVGRAVEMENQEKPAVAASG
jgi:hypothetical protein